MGELLVGLDPLGDDLDPEGPRHRQQARPRGRRRRCPRPSPATNERSSLIWSIGSARSCAIEVEAVPKSSSEIRTPSARSSRDARAGGARRPPLSAASEISTTIRSGAHAGALRSASETPRDAASVGAELIGRDVERERDPRLRVGRGDRGEVGGRAIEHRVEQVVAATASPRRPRRRAPGRPGRARDGASAPAPRPRRSARRRCRRSAGRRGSMSPTRRAAAMSTPSSARSSIRSRSSASKSSKRRVPSGTRSSAASASPTRDSGLHCRIGRDGDADRDRAGERLLAEVEGIVEGREQAVGQRRRPLRVRARARSSSPRTRRRRRARRGRPRRRPRRSAGRRRRAARRRPRGRGRG